MTTPRFLDAGETALVVEFGDAIDPALNDRVLALDDALRGAALGGVIETVPTFRSLLIQYDPLVIVREKLVAEVVARDLPATSGRHAGRRWRFPCCYEPPYGEDIAEVAARLSLTVDRVIALHTQSFYRLYMYGFAPGFAYLGGLAGELGISRREHPRPPHPVGAIMIAGGMSLVTTVAMPTGWWVIGRTPERMFAADRDPVFLAAVGDEIRFEPVDADTFARLAARARAGETIAQVEKAS
jgi:KipI family sensor histidine kinase inhibitor